MSAYIGDEFGKPGRNTHTEQVEQARIAEDLGVYSLEGVLHHAERARRIRQHIEWLLDDSQDLAIKKIGGFHGFFLEDYLPNLLAVSERALPYLATKHDESHPEFHLLESVINTLRTRIFALRRSHIHTMYSPKKP